MRTKRGMSAVISNLIIILLVIVAAGIIWSVVQGLIEEGAGDVSLEKFGVQAEITRTDVSPGSVEVQVENSGKNPMPGVRIILYDEQGDTTDFVKDVSISSNGRETFNLEHSGIVKSIGVEPRIEKEEEIENSGQVTETKEFSNKDILNVLGASSWFKLDGDSDNEIGGGKGTIYGKMECKEKGKYGQACGFNSEGDYINVSNINSLGKAQAYWVYDEDEWNFYLNNSDTEYVNNEEMSSNYSQIVSLDNGLRIGGSSGFSSGRVDEVIIFDNKLGEEAKRGIMNLKLNTA